MVYGFPISVSTFRHLPSSLKVKQWHVHGCEGVNVLPASKRGPQWWEVVLVSHVSRIAWEATTQGWGICSGREHSSRSTIVRPMCGDCPLIFSIESSFSATSPMGGKGGSDLVTDILARKGFSLFLVKDQEVDL
ncbi:hypothetical protein GOP47_0019689 [Adiantum capillus-veneris]|uniref:Uncharacterized protein n=1 Tax=Adiantum capillus-veneris TaxID=13818 RepID=A0A9D4UD08_ADICA|nr:hypothetical protein GOP47_0019689 [Adiantum capillus-veneris]